MYVCICRGITEKQIRQTVSQQNCSPQELTATIGVGADCGTCMAYACELLETLGNNSASTGSCSNGMS
ncbi:(2Fe-2S)-binding protein [[Limnothrix rosea] IAM M-220]|uniref:(2Fe-2S)-binding protein n=1 Tax=[Limnothrix rosea] IAM M-220 TaxID=454133 RepID=UPI00095C04E4|nr:(2Fe-2S)-binding protein [[Limnothrix rosea] IAM M-220]OKH19510.1 glycoprotein [[Limnothrix rosea] IAM M-220]